MPFVLDASVAAARFLPDEESAYANVAFARLAAGSALVPALFWFEVRNLLVTNERRGRISPAQVDIVVHQLADLPLEVDQTPSSEATLMLARAHKLSVYDAAYLELAQRRAVPLATLDQRLKAAAGNAGIALADG